MTSKATLVVVLSVAEPAAIAVLTVPGLLPAEAHAAGAGRAGAKPSATTAPIKIAPVHAAFAVVAVGEFAIVSELAVTVFVVLIARHCDLL